MRIIEKTLDYCGDETISIKKVEVADVVYQLFGNARSKYGALESAVERLNLLVELIIPLIENNEKAVANLCDVATRELSVYNTYTLEKENGTNLDKE